MSKTDTTGQRMVGFTHAFVKVEGGGEVLLHHGDPLPANAAEGEADRLAGVGGFENYKLRPRRYPPGTVVLGADASMEAQVAYHTPPEGEASQVPGFQSAEGGATSAGPVAVDFEGRFTDEELTHASASDLKAYVEAHPDETDRVVDAEWERTSPRSSILALRPDQS